MVYCLQIPLPGEKKKKICHWGCGNLLDKDRANTCVLEGHTAKTKTVLYLL